MNKKVILGLSGGVDSAVAAALLKIDGFDVYGVYLDAGLQPLDDVYKIAESVGIPLIIHDFKETLETNVCSYFIDEYLKGRTPNPCIVCNPTSKFKVLNDYSKEYNTCYIATGHYLKTTVTDDGKKAILKSPSNKDQSYMLSRLTPDVIEKLLFPLGDFLTKDEVRQKALELGLHVHKKPDSMEICFVPTNHTEYIESHGFKPQEGNFIDLNGNILGKHKGIHNYTVGQRRGLNISHTSRLFVHKIDAVNNTIILSDKDIYMDCITISDTSFAVDGFKDTTFEAFVKVRYSKNQEKASIISVGDTAKIIFNSPVRAPASGQSAVFYINDVLIGSGFID